MPAICGWGKARRGRARLALSAGLSGCLEDADALAPATSSTIFLSRLAKTDFGSQHKPTSQQLIDLTMTDKNARLKVVPLLPVFATVIAAKNLDFGTA